MEVWKEFEANELSHSAAHHLLAIKQMGHKYGGWARVSDIARELGITRGSVSINLRTLKKRGLVLTDEHRMVKLSDDGEKIVHGVMGKKVAVKWLLIHVLALDEAQAEIDSCKIEHLLSDVTAKRLIHLMRCLDDDKALARKLAVGFKRAVKAPSDTNTCAICKGRCLLEAAQFVS